MVGKVVQDCLGVIEPCIRAQVIADLNDGSDPQSAHGLVPGGCVLRHKMLRSTQVSIGGSSFLPGLLMSFAVAIDEFGNTGNVTVALAGSFLRTALRCMLLRLRRLRCPAMTARVRQLRTCGRPFHGACNGRRHTHTHTHTLTR